MLIASHCWDVEACWNTMKRIAKELFPWDVLCHFARNRVSDDVLRIPAPGTQLAQQAASWTRCFTATCEDVCGRCWQRCLALFATDCIGAGPCFSMFFSVNLTHRIAPGQPMMCHDTSYYIMIFPNSSDARWRMAAYRFFKFPRWAWQQAAHVGTLWGLLGGLPKKEKSWARWDMIMSHLGAGLEYYVMTNSYPKYVIVKYCQWMININYVIPGKSVSFTNKPWLGVLAVHFG